MTSTRPLALLTLLSVFTACNQGSSDGDAGTGTDAGTDAGCTMGRSKCGGACVDTAQDPKNCGTCGQTCGAIEICRAGVCAAACVVGEATLDAGTVDPQNVCTVCDPAQSTSGFSVRQNGVACDAGAVCVGGACAPYCFVGAVIRDAGAVNPDNACELCAPSSSTTAWSPRPNGTTCATGSVCESGTCSAKCFINGGLVAASSPNPANACEQCTPTTSTSAWSPRANGAACGSGQVCDTGACQAKCFIATALIAADAGNPANACEVCAPATSTNTWSPVADGKSCATGQICSAGVCATKCFIGGVVYSMNDPNPANACERCQPANSITAFTALATGASCGTGLVCSGGTCAAKCLISTGVYDAGTLNPVNSCEECRPATSTAAWTPRGLVPLLVGGVDVVTQGWAVIQQPTASLSYDAGVTRLVTATPNGAFAGGQLLLYRTSAAEFTAPFVIRAELLVESVSPHNQLDSAATIMPAYTVPFGVGIQRSQMVYLDSAAVGWADDTQTAAVPVVGQFHVYELAAETDGGLRFSVDGTQKLSRGGFVSNGTIAIGDQTNDANVDSAMRIKSVSRVCP